MRVRQLSPNVYASDDRFTFRDLMTRELQAAGFTVEEASPFLVATAGAGTCLFSVSDTSFQSFEAWRTLKNKVVTRALLKRLGLNYAAGRGYARDAVDEARRAVAEFGRAVVKPAKGSRGRGVAVDVTPSTFDDAWTAAWKERGSPRVLIERFFEGEEARYLVIDNICRAVLRRIPPAIVGDGSSTIEHLVRSKNSFREKNPHLSDKLIFLDGQRLALLQAKGFSVGDIPRNGEHIILDPKGNLSTGADSEDITDIVHEDYVRMAETISLSVPGCHVVGVDILSVDHMAPAAPEEYIIIEANTGPGLLGHYYPMYGLRRNVFKMVAESSWDRLNRTSV